MGGGYAASGVVVFFFQAEDGIRYVAVTGVQTCALPIYGNAGQALEFQTDLGVGPHRCRCGYRDRRIDAARAIRRKAEIRHFADADSVEQYGGADQQPWHRAIELDVIGRARTKPTGVVKPVDKAEYGGDGREHEGADDDERSAGFHLNSPLVAASGSACRENRPAPRDARIEAVRASDRWRRSCRPPAPQRDRRRYSGWRGRG